MYMPTGFWKAAARSFFNADTPDVPGGAPGDMVEFDDAFLDKLPDLLSGRGGSPQDHEQRAGELKSRATRRPVSLSVFPRSSFCPLENGFRYSLLSARMPRDSSQARISSGKPEPPE